MKIPGTVLLLVISFYSTTTVGQSEKVKLSTLTLNAGGDFFSNETFKVTSSIGEMAAVHTVISPNFILSNGVLQPPVTQTTAGNNNPYSLNIYPTLTNGNFIYLDAAVSTMAMCNVKIYSITGQVVATYSISVNPIVRKREIPLTLLSRGEYFVELTLSGRDYLTPPRQFFKIQKL